jgi:hypothetical protein
MSSNATSGPAATAPAAHTPPAGVDACGELTRKQQTLLYVPRTGGSADRQPESLEQVVFTQCEVGMLQGQIVSRPIYVIIKQKGCRKLEQQVLLNSVINDKGSYNVSLAPVKMSTEVAPWRQRLVGIVPAACDAVLSKEAFFWLEESDVQTNAAAEAAATTTSSSTASSAASAAASAVASQPSAPIAAQSETAVTIAAPEPAAARRPRCG